MQQSKPVHVKAISRPIRIAFLLDPANTDHAMIDQLLAFANKAWGGCNFPFIPTDGSTIEKNWWSLLDAIDPDLIYSTVPLNDELIKKINRHVLPLQILLGEIRYKADTFSLSGLQYSDTLKLPEKYSNQALLRDHFFILLEKGSKTSLEVNFLIQNFGVIDGTVFTKDAFRHVQHEIFKIDEIDIKSFLNKITELRKSLVFPIELTRNANQLNFWHKHTRFFDGRHVVVGDTVLDRIYAWNRGIISYGGINFNGFWIPETFRNDPELLDLIGKLIHRKGWGTQPDRFSKIASHSTSAENLAEIDKMMSLSRHESYEILKMDSDTVPPIEEAFQRDSSEIISYYEIASNDHHSLVNLPTIEHISKRTGNWAVELQIQFKGDPNIMSSASWSLPKMPGIANCFFQPYSPARIDSRGYIVVFAKREQTTAQLGIPSPRRLFLSLVDNHEHSNLYPSKKRAEKRSKFVHMSSSNHGSYLRGMINLFGGLYSMGSTLEDPFWRETFRLWSGKSTELELKIQKEFKNLFLPDGTEQVTISKDQCNQAIKKASKMLFSIQEELNTIQFTKKFLRDQFGRIRNESLQNGENCFGENEDFDTYKKEDLDGFVETGILIQGVHQKCEHCGSQNWYRVDDLKAELRCEKCYNTIALLSDPTWSFQLNSLLVEGFKRHGSVAVIQALHALQSGTIGGTFVYLPSQNFYKENPWDGANPFAEIDFMALVNKKFVIAEVKSRIDGFTIEELERLEEVAMELKPHYLLLFAPYEQNSTLPSEISAKIQEIKNTLKTFDIQVALELMKWNNPRVLNLQ